MIDKTFSPLIQDTMQALAPHYRRATSAAFREAGFDGADWFITYVAHSQEPEPLTLAEFHRHYPYGSEERQRTQFAEATARGFLTAVSPDTYQLTDAGRAGLSRFFSAAQSALAEVIPLPAAELARLSGLLERVVTAAEENAPDTYQMKISRVTDPGPGAAATARIDQFVTDLSRFRDDAHGAAWSSLGVSGPAWEALTLLWQDKAHTADELAAQLPNRGHDAGRYAAALQELAGKGWVIEENGRFTLTPAGRQIREKAEADTETNYTIGLAALSTAEAADLNKLLTRFRDRLRWLTAEENTAVFQDTRAALLQISSHLFRLTRPIVDPMLEAANVAARGEANALLNARAAEPDAISTQFLGQRNPFTTPERLAVPLESLADKGYLAAEGEGTYRLTDDGRALADAFITRFRDFLGELESGLPGLSAEDLTQLADRLEQLTAACRSAGDPPGVTHITRSHNLAPKGESAALSRIDQAIDDLNAFRDDAHLAAFGPHKVTGHTWELFTALWREEVAVPAEMVEQHPHRGHDEEAYQMALFDLQKRGWVTDSSAGALRLTESGQQVREEAERLTDYYFYLPWTAVSGRQAEEFQATTQQLAAALQQLAEAEAVPA